MTFSTKDPQFLQKIADSIPGMVAVYNIHTGRYVFVNKAIRKLLGYEPEDFTKKGLEFVAGLVHSEDMPMIMEKNAQALEEVNKRKTTSTDEDPIVSFEYRMRHKDGSWKWLHTEGSVFNRSKAGQVDHVLNVSIDITERKEMEERLAETAHDLEERVKDRTIEQELLATTLQSHTDRLHSLLSSLPGVVWETLGLPGTDEQRITFVSDRAEALFGYPLEEWIKKGNFWRTIVHPDDQPEASELSKRYFETGEGGINRFRWVTKDGRPLWIESHVAVLKDEKGETVGLRALSIDITDRVKAELARQESEDRFARFMKHLPGLAWIKDAAGRYIFANESALRSFGVKESELLGNTDSDVFSNDIAEQFINNDKKVLAEEQAIQIVETFPQEDDIVHHSLVSKFPIPSNDGSASLIGGVAIDITKQKLAEEELHRSEERLRLMIEGVKDYGIFMLDTDGYIISWNEGAQRLFQYSEDEVIGKHASMFYATEGDTRQAVRHELELAEHEGKYTNETLRIRKDKSVFLAEVVTTALFDEEGKLRGFGRVVRDITERAEAEETIRHQALHDPLTGLPNRKALDERLEIMIRQAERHHSKIAVMFLDLDRFKNVNDSLGHMIGDTLLKEVASRFRATIRAEDTVARLGGDEFVLLLSEVTHSGDVINVSKKIIEAMQAPVQIGQHSLHITTSIGIALYPSDGTDTNALLKNADTALYRAKELGRNRYQFFNQTMNVQASERLTLETSLHKAIDANELELYYQPIINTKSENLAAVEALIRWNHPQLGKIYPNEFIPLAEEIGIIFQMGEWVLRTACRQLKAWQEQGISVPAMSINLSARQFSEPRLMETIKTIINDSDIQSDRLEFEITEGIAMENLDRTVNILRYMKQIGINITIDDFGTGYSSLNYLKRFPLHGLKIDKSFVRHAITNSQDATIIRTIIAMAHSLGLKVIAEGVETEQQLNFLKQLDCDRVQGYYLGMPMPGTELVTWVEDRA